MKEHALILIWRQWEIWAAAIITISFINDISIRIYAGTAKELVFGGKTLIIFLCLMSISLIIHRSESCQGFVCV